EGFRHRCLLLRLHGRQRHQPAREYRVTRELRQPDDRSMQLSSTLSWLVDAAGDTPGADTLLAEIGTHLVADGLPLAGGALTLAVPHPLIAQRTWLWRAGSGGGLEAFGFVAGGLARAGWG